MTTRATAVLIMMNKDYFDYFVDDCEHDLITMMIMTMLKGVYLVCARNTYVTNTYRYLFRR